MSKKLKEIIYSLPSKDNECYSISEELQLLESLHEVVKLNSIDIIISTIIESSSCIVNSSKEVIKLFHGRFFSLELNVINKTEASVSRSVCSTGYSYYYISMSRDIYYEERKVIGSLADDNLKLSEPLMKSGSIIQAVSNKNTIEIVNSEKVYLFKLTKFNNYNPILEFSRGNGDFISSIDVNSEVSRINNTLKLISSIGSDFTCLNGIINQIHSNDIDVRWNAFIAYANIKSGKNLDKKILNTLANDRSVKIRRSMERLVNN